MNEKWLFTLEEASRMAGISTSMCRKLIRNAQLEVVRIGRAVRVPRHEILRLCGVSNHGEVSK